MIEQQSPTLMRAHLYILAEKRWGDVKTTTEVLRWENGDFRVEVWHTFHTTDQPGNTGTGRAVLQYSSHRGKILEQVTEVGNTPGRFDVHYEEVLDDG